MDSCGSLQEPAGLSFLIVDLPSEESLRWVVSRYAALRKEHASGIGEPALVQPTPDDFPDAFELSAEGVGRFLTRMLGYAPVAADLDVRLRVVEGEGGGGGGGCGTKACGSGACGVQAQSFGDRVIDAEDGYIVELPTTAAGHPLRLAAALARSVGTIVLCEAGEELDPSEVGAVSEVAATASGLGVLLLGGSYLFGKSCGGVRVEQCTHLDVMELSVALALFTRIHGHKPSRAKQHLEVTQREALGEALAWVDSNPDLLADLRERPEMLSDGVFEVRPAHGLFGGLFRRLFGGGRSPEAPMEAAPPSRRTPRSEEEQKRLDRARALVDEALGGASSEGE
jgi:hypothetical protein